MTKKLSKYVKIVMLCTLAESKTLVDISTEWFNNKARLYHPVIIKEIKEAVANGLLIQEKKKFYRVNIPKFLELITDLIKLGDDSRIATKYKKVLKYFYLDLGEYTQKVYFNYEIIKILTKLDQKKAEELDPALLIQLPFILRYLEYKDKPFVNILVQLMGLEEYVETIQRLERKYIYILDENRLADRWIESFETLIKLLPKLQKKGMPLFQKNTQKIKVFGGKE